MLAFIKKFASDAGWAFLIAAASSAAGLLANNFRADGLDMVVKEPFKVYKVCGTAPLQPQPVTAQEALKLSDCKDSIFLDCRTFDEFRVGHIPGAENVPYDPSHPIDPRIIEKLKQYRDVVTYCDMTSPALACPSTAFAAELMKAGLDNVRYLEGGAGIWRELGGKWEGKCETKKK